MRNNPLPLVITYFAVSQTDALCLILYEEYYLSEYLRCYSASAELEVISENKPILTDPQQNDTFLAAGW